MTRHLLKRRDFLAGSVTFAGAAAAGGFSFASAAQIEVPVYSVLSLTRLCRRPRAGAGCRRLVCKGSLPAPKSGLTECSKM